MFSCCLSTFKNSNRDHFVLSFCLVKRQFLNELQNEYCVKTQIIALDWHWVTLRSRCQMNRNGHSPPVKHYVEGKPFESLEKLNITSWKINLNWIFFVHDFQITCVHNCISHITNDKLLYFTHVWLCLNLVFIYCWLFDDFTFWLSLIYKNWYSPTGLVKI